MTKEEVQAAVAEQMRKGLSREEAIRHVAFFIGDDDPVDAEIWFQQKIGGG